MKTYWFDVPVSGTARYFIGAKSRSDAEKWLEQFGEEWNTKIFDMDFRNAEFVDELNKVEWFQRFRQKGASPANPLGLLAFLAAIGRPAQ